MAVTLVLQNPDTYSNGQAIPSPFTPYAGPDVTVTSVTNIDSPVGFNGDAFDIGASSKMSAPASIFGTIGSQDWSVEGLIKPSNLSSVITTICAKKDDAGAWTGISFVLGTENFKFRAWLSSTGAPWDFDLTGTAVLINNQSFWFYMECVGGALKVYIEGVLDISANIGAFVPFHSATAPFLVADVRAGTVPRVLGQYDQFRVSVGSVTGQTTRPGTKFGAATYKIYGVIRDAFDALAARVVRRYLQSTGAFIDTVTSSAITGAYEFSALGAAISCQLTVSDTDPATMLAKGNVTPVISTDTTNPVNFTFKPITQEYWTEEN